MNQNILIVGDYGKIFLDPLSKALGDSWTVQHWTIGQSKSNLLDLASKARILVVTAELVYLKDTQLIESLIKAGRQLQLIQVPFSGMEWLDKDWLTDGCRVCNTNQHSEPIAEYVMLGILEFAIHMRLMDRELRQGRWTFGGSIVRGKKHSEIQNKTIGFIGFGHIAKRVTELATPFGMKFLAISRTPKEDPRLEWWKDSSHLDQLLSESDYILITSPLSDSTRDMINARTLRKMKSTGVIINVARGPIINEEAIYQALKNHQIGGAVLDVWYQYASTDNLEMQPSVLPFHELDNVIMTPHTASWTDDLDRRRIESLTKNIQNFINKKPLLEIVY
ncbi:2-hydroxyacid dehydrogenase [Polynucleobacter sp. CS-Odin-A6]|uniref:2-hydroxyacid dehydrogenase n=1 Tax=Polynucleobacter sp. CS-Odin-A6 TaxID=2689106 RepID=UPI001C0BDF58|nr:2-hydroxyacid dehydrogenase [Polynucleobacter sp. CS-Odin-A6]MBU3620386.1 phosphoglycerate dehydrogenase [Polynucleobacter sp. CS-Odin-A6]